MTAGAIDRLLGKSGYLWRWSRPKVIPAKSEPHKKTRNWGRFLTLSRANFGVRHKLCSMSFISLAKARRKTGRACHRSARARHHSDAGILSLPWRGENLSGELRRNAGLLFEADQRRRFACVSVLLSFKIKGLFVAALARPNSAARGSVASRGRSAVLGIRCGLWRSGGDVFNPACDTLCLALKATLNPSQRQEIQNILDLAMIEDSVHGQFHD